MFSGNGSYLYNYFLVFSQKFCNFLGVRAEVKPRNKIIQCYKRYLLWLIQKQLNDIVSALGVVEEDKERPVNEPCPLLERLERGGDRLDRTKIEIQADRREKREESVKEAQKKQRKKNQNVIS